MTARARTRTLTALLVAAALVVGVVVLATRSHPSPSPPASAADDPAHVVERPLPAGGADAAGARAAAIEYATGPQRWLYMTDAAVTAELAAITGEEIGAAVIDDVVGELRLARDALSAAAGRVWWFVSPLATRVDPHGDGTRVRVSVWSVSVISAEGVAVPQSDYQTDVFDLAWRDGGWRIVGIAEAVGPTPTLVTRDEPWDARRFDEALDGFARLLDRPISGEPAD